MTKSYPSLPLILASTSPRRRELLVQAGVDFMVQAVDIDETWQPTEKATDYITRMVNEKAKAVAAIIQDESLVVTADTIGVLDCGEVLTKPKNRADAYRMWERLSGDTHEIWTAVCVSHVKQGGIVQKMHLCECTQVVFVPLTQQMKDDYWQTGEPYDKAGAYAIQGRAAAWVKSIQGSYTNVVGLPLAQTLALIEKMQKQAAYA